LNGAKSPYIKGSGFPYVKGKGTKRERKRKKGRSDDDGNHEGKKTLSYPSLRLFSPRFFLTLKEPHQGRLPLSFTLPPLPLARLEVMFVASCFSQNAGTLQLFPETAEGTFY
jgi:hypothetical protein